MVCHMYVDIFKCLTMEAMDGSSLQYGMSYVDIFKCLTMEAMGGSSLQYGMSYVDIFKCLTMEAMDGSSLQSAFVKSPGVPKASVKSINNTSTS